MKASEKKSLLVELMQIQDAVDEFAEGTNKISFSKIQGVQLALHMLTFKFDIQSLVEKIQEMKTTDETNLIES